MDTIEKLMAKLPPELQQEVRDFAQFAHLDKFV
jgi:hypothetical protein